MSTTMNKIVLFSGSSHPALTEGVAKYLNTTVAPSIHDSFANGERRVELQQNVRKRHVFILQTGSNSTSDSVNDMLVELLLMVDAAKLSDAKSITVIIPHFAYARQDKKDRSRTPISSSLVASLLQTAGVTRVVTLDLHSSQIQGFFHIPVDNLFARGLIIKHLNDNFFAGLTKEEVQQKFVLVSPDAGGTKRVLKMAQKMELRSVLMHKERDHSQKNHVEKTLIVGEEGCIRGRTCIIVDDMTDTMGTVIKACEVLVENGAVNVIVCITHGILSGPALERVKNCDAITHVVTSNSLPQTEHLAASEKISVFDISELLGECISRIVRGGSISTMFN